MRNAFIGIPENKKRKRTIRAYLLAGVKLSDSVNLKKSGLPIVGFGVGERVGSAVVGVGVGEAVRRRRGVGKPGFWLPSEPPESLESEGGRRRPDALGSSSEVAQATRARRSTQRTITGRTSAALVVPPALAKMATPSWLEPILANNPVAGKSNQLWEALSLLYRRRFSRPTIRLTTSGEIYQIQIPRSHRKNTVIR